MGYLCARYHVADVDCAQVIISSHNSLGDGRYYDVESSSSFHFDHTKRVRTRSGSGSNDLVSNTNQEASAVQSYVLEGAQADLVYDRPCHPHPRQPLTSCAGTLR